MTEIRKVPGFEHYWVDEDGQIYSLAYNRCYRLRPWLLSPGYPCVTLHIHCKKVKMKTAVIVLMSFIGPRPFGADSCHNDGNILNNKLSNLRWDTHRNNQKDMIIHKSSPKGERNGQSKLTQSDVLEICKMLDEHKTRAEIARKFRVDRTNIIAIAKGRNWSWLSGRKS